MSDESNKVVAVTGATGFVGRRVLAHLLGAGFDARILARSAPKAERVVEGLGLDAARVGVVEGTISDPDTLARLVRGVDACIHLVGIIREARGGQTFERIHVDATRSIVNACANERAGMRYLHMSALGVGPDPRAGYRDSKHRAAQIVRSSSLRWTVFKPGLVFGPDGEFTQMCAGWVRGSAPPFVFLPYFSRWRPGGFGFEAPRVAPVHVEDVARAFVGALAAPASEKRAYEMSGPDPIRFDDMLRIYRAHVPGAKSWLRPIGIPWRLAAVQARVAKLVGLGGLLPFDEGMAIMGGRDSVAENADLTRDLGIEPAPFEETLETFADRL